MKFGKSYTRIASKVAPFGVVFVSCWLIFTGDCVIGHFIFPTVCNSVVSVPLLWSGLYVSTYLVIKGRSCLQAYILVEELDCHSLTMCLWKYLVIALPD